MPLITSPVDIFLTVLLIILLAPMLLTKLKIPHIIGLILGGMIVGPNGFNLLARDAGFDVFGQVGLLYLMFLAGIEIDMYHLKKNLGKGLGFGAFTFVVPMVLGTMAAHWALGLDWLTSALMAAMFAAHTLIGYPIVSRFGLTKSPSVIIAVAGTIVTVLASLIAMASIVDVIGNDGFEWLHVVRLVLALAAFCLVTVYLYPRITLWFFRNYHDNILQFIFVLTALFVAAAVASLAGIEGVFGAFFAGIVLNRYIPMRSSLMGRIEFVGNAIFIPYFLIGVGMLINVRVIGNGVHTLVVAAIMCAVAMATKWLAAWLAQKAFRLGSIDRSMMYQLSNAHTAVALAVVMTGHRMGVFDETILNATVIMILVTCTVASLGVERAARRMVVDRATAQGTPAMERSAAAESPHHKLISVATPYMAKQLMDLAMFMRRKTTDPGKLYALHVRSDNATASRAMGRNSLDTAQAAADGANQRVIPIERYDANIVTGVLNTLAEREITDLYLGLHRRKRIIDTYFGSKIEQLLKSTKVMVVIARTFIPINTLRRIVVVVPPAAHYEGGFTRWVEALGNLARQVGCRIIFHGAPEASSAVRAVLARGRYGIRQEYREVDYEKDFPLLAGRVNDDDLFVVIAARRASVSFMPVMDELPDFLEKYYSEANLIYLYPEQVGGEAVIAPTMAETMTTDLAATPGALWLSVRRALRRALAVVQRLRPGGSTEKEGAGL